jgi:phosphatidylserine/phosphatidylglycerophosphate/cardiolipin synthase-like enzyme
MNEVASIAAIPVIQGISPIAAIPQVVQPATRVGGFRLMDLPLDVRTVFRTGARAFPKAARKAIGEGITDPAKIADIIFFMQHPGRMTANVGKLIAADEPEFVELRAEWEQYFIIAERLLDPAKTPDIFLPERASRKYEEFIARRTTGKVTLMMHGRNSDGSGKLDAQKRWVGGFRDVLDTYDRMQQAVASLRAGDVLYLAGWVFIPTGVPIPTNADPAVRTWGDLLKEKALAGVTIRVLIAQHTVIPLIGSVSPFMTPLKPLNDIINSIEPPDKQDHFKYIVTPHADFRGVHHQKFMVAKQGKSAVAFCGGLDLTDGRATRNWWVKWVWHDVAAKVEGRIARDLERQFVELWNHERGRSTAAPLAGWKGYEKLTVASAGIPDKAGAVNQHPVQMLRTVSVGIEPSQIQRDDIWRAYFRLIGRATRFLYFENPYFHEPKLADAILKQVQSQPGMIVIIMVSTGTDDRQTVDPSLPEEERERQQAMVDITQNQFALRLEFFKKLEPLYPTHLRVYTIHYVDGLLHAKLILVDDAALSAGSANANPRGFFLDTELNILLDHEETVRDFRHRLWAHDLGLPAAEVAKWSIGEYFTRWDKIADSNLRLKATPEKMVGEGVIPFKPWDSKDPRFRAGRRGSIRYRGLEFASPKVLF